MIKLKSLTVSNFRSIRGSINVPLDAPVVLIHGQNGSGKTSMLAAIEFALTGEVPSLERIDPRYRDQLLHKECKHGLAKVEVAGLTDDRSQGEFQIERNRFTGTPLLDERLSRFFHERCYLAQSALGRLLEIYENSDTRSSDSPLTKFVKELLGLDQLDAVIDGLHEAGDVRRFRSAVPSYWETRENIPMLHRDLAARESELQKLVNEENEVTRHITDRSEIVASVVPTPPDWSSLLARLKQSEREEEAQLQQLATQRREVQALRLQWENVASRVSAEERASIERRAAETAATLERWRAVAGKRLDEVLQQARLLIQDLPPPASIGLGDAVASALGRTRAELSRITAALALDAKDEQKSTNLDQEIERAKARVIVLDNQIAQHARESGALAKALGEMVPHIQTEDCPVCGRDYREFSSTPLHAHVLHRIAELSESAGQLEALFRERTTTLTSQANSERERAVVEGRRLETTSRNQYKEREADLKDLVQALDSLANPARHGDGLTSAATAASAELADLESRDLRATAVRDSVDRFEHTLSLDLVGPAGSISAAIDRLDSHVEERITALSSRQDTRRQITERVRDASALQARRVSANGAVQQLRQQIDVLKRRQEAADALIQDARELARRARAVRTNTVRRVFNNSLNTIWRDLFVRLAPEELFVPAFALPADDGGPVEAILETHYKSGGKGGNPRAMLSAGNLNTAALTLFLALHLSVAPQLPWLIIDDPIQSMDEIHIAQLAALLRTLSKAHHRQVIIAVHEKPLFDYLTLELSPAFPADRLITVELGRNASGETIIKYEPRVWQPDTAIAA
jgi:exonuclease SbcC